MGTEIKNNAALYCIVNGVKYFMSKAVKISKNTSRIVFIGYRKNKQGKIIIDKDFIAYERQRYADKLKRCKG